MTDERTDRSKDLGREPDPLTVRNEGILFGLREAVLFALAVAAIAVTAALYHL